MEDLPWREVRIFEDGAERRGMREIGVSAHRGAERQFVAIRSLHNFHEIDD